MSSRVSRLGVPVLIAAVVAIVLTAAPVAQAGTLMPQNLTQLISESQSIIDGTVKTVTDGIGENGLPFTEVTIVVGGSVKGSIEDGSEYTFRQYGLIRPRTLDNGKVLLTTSPAGFPSWREGEAIIAFLHRPASLTGLQTTAGLAQGKLVRFGGNTRAANEFDNVGLFDDVWINPVLTTPEERSMLATPGPVDPETLMNLVYRAVTEQWIENGEMR